MNCSYKLVAIRIVFLFFICIPFFFTGILYSKNLERLPFSSERLLTESDLKGFSKYDLKIARNEIFARKGYDFKGSLRDHFSKFSWYDPTTRNVTLSEIEIENVSFIKKYEETPKLFKRLSNLNIKENTPYNFLNTCTEEGNLTVLQCVSQKSKKIIRVCSDRNQNLEYRFGENILKPELMMQREKGKYGKYIEKIGSWNNVWLSFHKGEFTYRSLSKQKNDRGRTNCVN